MDNKIKLGIMQPYFFPYIGYFQLMNAVDTYVVYDDVNFIKGGWINRNNIMIGNKSQRINLILSDASPNKLINEIEIKHDLNIYRDKLLKTIQMNYSKAPFFDKFFPVLEQILLYDEFNLSLFLYNSFVELNKYMEIKTRLVLSSGLSKDNSLKGEDKVLDICRVLNAGEYYNAIGGSELYSKERFAQNNIDLYFLKTDDDLKYDQYKGEFVPNLSIIDVLMFNSVEQVHNLLGKYTLI